MNARTIVTLLVCLAVVFAGCAGMNDGTGGDSAEDGATGDTASGAPDDTATAPPDTPTASGDDGTTTQSATAEDEQTATTQPTTTAPATISADKPTTVSETTTPDTTAGSGGGDSASVSNPFTEGDYFRLTGEIVTPARTTEFVLAWRMLSVEGEQVTIKVTNPETGESETIQSDWRQVFSNLDNLSLFPQLRFPIDNLIPLLHAPVAAAQGHSLEVGSEWTITHNITGSATYAVTGTDTVAGITCKEIKITGGETDFTACVNKNVFFSLHFSSSGKLKITLTVEEYRSGDG